MSTSTTISALNPVITYSDHWSNKSDGTMVTNNAGATARLAFEGTFVQVFGTIPAAKQHTIEPVSNYSLDGASPAQFDASKLGETSGAQDFAFYQSDPDLASGKHYLVITSAKNDANFILSSIVVSKNNAGSDPSSNSSVPPTSASDAPIASSSSPTGKSQSLTSSTSNVGGIVGGIVAALVVFSTLVAFFLLRRRRKQRTAKRHQVTPFVPERNESTFETPNYTSQNLYTSQTPQPRYDEKEPLPEPSLGPSSLVRHGSMYKPRTDSDNLPPMEFGYGGGV